MGNYVYGLYVPTCIDPFYIGRTQNPKARLSQHRSAFRHEMGNDIRMELYEENLNKGEAEVLEAWYTRYYYDNGLMCIKNRQVPDGPIDLLSALALRRTLLSRYQRKNSIVHYKERIR